MRFTGPLLARLRSLQLTLLLFFLLAAMAALGTILPPERLEAFYRGLFGEGALPAIRFFGLVDTYGSPLFINLLLLLMVNVTLCTWHRLKSRGASGAGTLSKRVRLLLDGGLHLSLVLLLAGGTVRSIWGFVGTRYLFLDYPTAVVEEKHTGEEVPLGFSVVLRERETLYFPLGLRLQVSPAGGEGETAVVELVERRRVRLPGVRLTASIESFDPGAGEVWLRLAGGGDTRLLPFGLGGGEGAEHEVDGYRIKLTAYRRMEREVRHYVAILEGEGEVGGGWLTPRKKVSYRGTSFFQNAWGTDDYGFQYVGVQVARDPGAPIFWTGAVLLSLCLPLFMVMRRRPLRRELPGGSPQ